MVDLESSILSIKNDINNAIKLANNDKTSISLLDTMKDCAQSILDNLHSYSSYQRLPKVHIFDDLGHIKGIKARASGGQNLNQQVFSILAAKNKLQVGDVLMCATASFVWSEKVFLVGRNGAMKFLFKDDDSDQLCLPAWVLEIGMQHGRSFKALVKIYSAACENFVYPLSMQGKHVDKDGRYKSLLISMQGKDVIVKKNSKFPYIFRVDSDVVFLDDNGKSRNVDSKCVAQTTKKYTDRPSPPFPAADCPGLTKKGNNGKMYVSAANVKGIYSWKVVKS